MISPKNTLLYILYMNQSNFGVIYMDGKEYIFEDIFEGAWQWEPL